MGLKEILDARQQAIANDQGFDKIGNTPEVEVVEEVVDDHCEDCSHDNHDEDCDECDCC